MAKNSILNNIFPIAIILLFTSCGTMFYGSSTKVTLKSEEGNTEKVNIVAIGPKKIQEFNNVTLPLDIDVKHNNFPLEVNVVSATNKYKPFNMNYETKGEKLGNVIYNISLGVGLPISAAGLISLPAGAPLVGGILVGGAGVICSFGLLSRETTPTKVPLFDIYSIKSSTNDSAIVFDKNLAYQHIYNKENAKALGTINYLLTNETNSELMYMKALAYYQAGHHKDAIKHLDLAYSLEKKTSFNPKPMADYSHLKDLFRLESYRQISKRYIKSADKVVGWLVSKEESAEFLYMQGLIYALKDNLGNSQKSLKKAYQLSDKNDNPKLHENIAKSLKQVADQRTAKRQENLQSIAKVAGAMVVVAGIAASQSYSKQNMNSTTDINSSYNNQNNYSNTPERSGSKYELTEVQCSLCKGKGYIIEDKAPTFGIDEKKYCNECGGYFPLSHTHGKCPSCRGTGKNKKGEWK